MCSRTSAAPSTQGVTTHTCAVGCFNIINSPVKRTIEKLRISKALKDSEFSLMEISAGFSNVRRHQDPLLMIKSEPQHGPSEASLASSLHCDTLHKIESLKKKVSVFFKPGKKARLTQHTSLRDSAHP